MHIKLKHLETKMYAALYVFNQICGLIFELLIGDTHNIHLTADHTEMVNSQPSYAPHLWTSIIETMVITTLYIMPHIQHQAKQKVPVTILVSVLVCDGLFW